MKFNYFLSLTAYSFFLCATFTLIACDDGFTQSDIDNAVNEATESLNEEITELKADLELAETQIATLEAKKAALEKEKSNILSNIEKLDAEITTLRSKKSELESNINANQSEIEELNSAISILEKEKEELIAKANKLNSNILEKENEIEKLETENTGLKYCLKGEHEYKYIINNNGTHDYICSICHTTFADNENHTFDLTDTCVCGSIRLEITSITTINNNSPNGWTHEENLDGSTETIGTIDDGKTKWENRDLIVVDFTSTQNKKIIPGIQYSDRVDAWVHFNKINSSNRIYYLKEETPKINAIYSPFYRINSFGDVEYGCLIDDTLDCQNKGVFEYILLDNSLSDSATITIDFSNIKRTYSRLRIVTTANQTITVTTSNFTPAGETQAKSQTYTLTADERGNTFLYGSFAIGATITVKSDETFLAEYTFSAKKHPNGTEFGKSYVLDARAIMSPTDTATTQR